MAEDLRIDDAYMMSVVQKLKQIRNAITMVRAGVDPNKDPNNMASPHGQHLNSLVISTGSTHFKSGVDLKTRIATVGSQVDQRLSAADQKLSSYGQNLERIISDTDSIEEANTSYSANTKTANSNSNPNTSTSTSTSTS
ncbi:hypothetical protein ACWDV4_28960 [Micromonospora sp. NPDC003197]